jgi:hypothetical protein
MLPSTSVSFNAWFAALPLVLKLLVILGIVAGSLAVGVSFVTSTFRIWRAFGDFLSRREKGGKEKKRRDPKGNPGEKERRRDIE